MFIIRETLFDYINLNSPLFTLHSVYSAADAAIRNWARK